MRRKPSHPKPYPIERDSDLLTPIQAAELIGLDERTLANWRSLGKGPRFFKPTAKKVLYSKAEIVVFLTRIEAQSVREARKKQRLLTR